MRWSGACAPLALTVSLLGASCSGEGTPKPARYAPPTNLLARVLALEEARGGWVSTRRRVGRLTQCQRWGTGRLCVDGDGERWLDKAPQPVLSPYRAPEILIGILGEFEGYWEFLGASGQVYRAASPLGAWVDARPPAEPFVRVVLAPDGQLAGVTTRRELWRSTDRGVHYRAVAGPAGALTDLRFDESSRLALLTAPEALYRESSPGLFERRDVAPVGARELLSASSAGLRVATRGQPALLTPQGRWVEASEPLVSLTLSAAPALLPDPRALREQRYVERAGQVALLRPGATSGAPQELWTGSFGGPLTLAGRAEHCASPSLTWLGAQLVVSCENRTGQFTVRRVTEHPEGPFAELGPSLAGEGLLLRDLGAGQVLLQGYCAEKGCPGSRLATATFGAPQPARLGVPKVLTVSGLTERALATATEPTRGLVAVLARRQGATEPTLWLSSDRAQHLSELSLEHLPTLSSKGGAFRVESLTWHETRLQLLASVTQRFLAWELELDTKRQRALLLDTDTLAAAWGPQGLVTLSKSGELQLSRDGGASFVAWGSPPGFRASEPGSEALACAEAGCLFGNERVSLRLGYDELAATPTPLPPGVNRASASPPAFRAAQRCQLDARGWRTIAHADYVPSITHAGLGDVGWFVTSTDWQTGAVSSHAYNRAADRIDTRVLLKPGVRNAALAVVPQVEGVAVLRVVLPEALPARLPFTLEAGWDNFIHSSHGVGKTTVPVADLSALISSLPTTDKLGQLAPKLVSVVGERLLVGLPGAGTSLLAFSSTGVQSEAFPERLWQQSERDLLLAGGQLRSFVMASDKDASWVVQETRDGKSRDTMLTVNGYDLRRFAVPLTSRLSYSGKIPGWLVGPTVAREASAQAWFVSVAADLSASLQVQGLNLDRPEPLRRCSPVERAGSPRVMSRGGQWRQPLQLDLGSAGRFWFVSVAELGYGQGEQACTDMIALAPLDAESKLFLLYEPGGKTWVFRARDDAGSLGWHQALCQASPELTLPETLQRLAAPGED